MSDLTEKDVADYLKANPGFFENRAFVFVWNFELHDQGVAVLDKPGICLQVVRHFLFCQITHTCSLPS